MGYHTYFSYDTRAQGETSVKKPCLAVSTKINLENYLNIGGISSLLSPTKNPLQDAFEITNLKLKNRSRKKGQKHEMIESLLNPFEINNTVQKRLAEFMYIP